MVFQDREEAGRRLSDHLAHYAGRPDLLVLALPRGGVPVAYEVARALGAPLDVFLVRKLGVPGHEELAMGAIASSGAGVTRVLNESVVAALGIPRRTIEEASAREELELERRERAYRGDRRPPDVRGRTVVLVDEGLATGSTMRAAAAALRAQHPARLVIAVPVASRDTCEVLKGEVDEVVCAATPEPFYGVGMWYRTFDQIGDEEVRDLLAKAELSPGPRANPQ